MQTKDMFQKYHGVMFKEQKKPLKIYFVFDIVGYILMIINAVIDIVFPTNVANIYLGAILEIYFPLIQTFGVCYFKATLDPISKVSSLDYLKIVSINQMPTDSFYKSCITENSFAKEEHKREIEQEYMRKKSNASSIIATTIIESES